MVIFAFMVFSPSSYSSLLKFKKKVNRIFTIEGDPDLQDSIILSMSRPKVMS